MNREAALGAAGVATVITAWAGASAADLPGFRAIPGPYGVARAARDLLGSGAYRSALADTLVTWANGVLLAAVVAIPAGILIGSLPLLRRAVLPIVEMARPIPAVSLIPVAILLFGIDRSMKLSILVYALTWPMLLQTMYGLSAIDPGTVLVGRALRWSRFTILRRIALPSAAPFISTGLRLIAGLGLVIVVGAEIIGSATGVGVQIARFQTAGNTESVFAAIVIMGVIGLAVGALLVWLDRKLLFWLPAHRSERGR
jgi:NitT/TauT family transport system permease protein